MKTHLTALLCACLLMFSATALAAKSPAFSIAGPDVILILTPISFAIIPARVVFPSPGGP